MARIKPTIREKKHPAFPEAQRLLFAAGEAMTMPIQVTAEQLDAIVTKAVAQLPSEFRAALEVVPIRVCDRPTSAQLQSLGLDESELLLGLYEGIPLTERSVNDSPRVPDRISLFKEDLEEACDSLEQFEEEVRITLFHELGHYFGFDEDALDELGYG